MKKIGFIGAYDKSNFIIYVAKILQLLNYKVLVIDTTLLQKIKYIVPAINPTKSYITDFDGIDFAVGFDSFDEIEKYLGIRFYSNEDETRERKQKQTYDYVLIDIDSYDMFEKFEMKGAIQNYFVTSFDMYSLKRGLKIFEDIDEPQNLTRILFSYEQSKEDEEYLNFISLEYKIVWNDFILYVPIFDEDTKVIQENERFEKIRYKKLSLNYKEALAYIVQDINKVEGLGKIKKVIKD